jgi:hypothetical protein
VKYSVLPGASNTRPVGSFYTSFSDHFTVKQHGMACCRLFSSEMFFTAWLRTQKLVLSRWGTYFGCCSQRDGTRTSTDTTGAWWARIYSAVITTANFERPTLFRLSSPSCDALQTPTKSSTRQLLSIHYHTRGPRDNHSATMSGLLTKKSINKYCELQKA